MYEIIWQNCCVKREREELLRFIPGYDTIRDPYFFILPPWRWYKTDIKFLIMSSLFCLYKANTDQYTTETSAWLSYFLLGLYSLLTLASLVHLDFYPPLNPEQAGPHQPVPRTAWQLISLSILFSAHCWLLLAPGMKNFCHYIFFGRPHNSELLFLPASHSCNSELEPHHQMKFSIISRIPIWRVLLLCRDAIIIFYCPSWLGWKNITQNRRTDKMNKLIN